MSTDFNMWFLEGSHHILTLDALDHILYILALCLAYQLNDWKKMLLLITAFTIGHSITLLLVSLQMVNINSKWVEFFIPITIAITALLNIVYQKDMNRPSVILYSLALFFGFIHGMAYGANTIGSLYAGKEAVWLVLAFNLGVEVAQILVVISFSLLTYCVVNIIQLPRKYWKISLSSIILVYSIFLTIKNLP